MGVPGRKPKPAALRRLEGNAGKRPIVEEARVGDAISAASVPEPPDYLPEQAADVWREILPEIAEVGLARTIDLPVLEALCVHVAIAREAMAALTEDGRISLAALVTTTEKGTPVVAPEHRIYRDSWREAMAIAEHYGLTPISRTRLGIAAMQARSLAEELRDALSGDDVIEGEAVEVVEPLRAIEPPKAG